jgi:16S rRNA G966 N2-methylase RsmD
MKLLQKIKNLSEHIRNTGFREFISTKLYDYFIRVKLMAAGVNFSKTTAQLTQATAISANNDAHENQASSFYILKKGLAALPLATSEISLLDIGCGSGRVMNYCMLRKVKAVAGIDLDDDALQIAAANCKLLFNKGFQSTYAVEKADATVYSIPASVNTVYMFNPFGRQTMQATVVNITGHSKKTNAPVYVIYCMPAFKDIFENDPACTKIYEEFNKDKSRAELTVFKIAAV